MIKKQYLKERQISATCTQTSANKKADVLKIQSWLNLFAGINPSAGTATAIDGSFGPSTKKAVVNFQTANALSQNGEVDATVFGKLSDSLTSAFEAKSSATNLRDIVVDLAHIHLAQKPFELSINGQANSGPWVRSYMDENEGNPWFWCMGFAQSILDQAFSQLGQNFQSLMPLSYSCDVVAMKGIEKKILIRSKDVRNQPSLVKPGDLFLLQKSATDWHHTGLIIGVDGDVFDTIEGNTNTDGSPNGNGVYKRVRNFRTQTLDVFPIA
jgi:hypothetical protein